jgi:GTP-binding GTPase N-terminal
MSMATAVTDGRRIATRQVVGSTFQQLEAPSPRSYLGSGKVQEIVEAVQATGASTVIADDELSPVRPCPSHHAVQRSVGASLFELVQMWGTNVGFTDVTSIGLCVRANAAKVCTQ